MVKLIVLGFSIFTLIELNLASTLPFQNSIYPCRYVEYANLVNKSLIKIGILRKLLKLAQYNLPAFKELQIMLTNIEEIPADVLASVKFDRIVIRQNPNLYYIHPAAFEGTTGVTTWLEIGHSKTK